MDERHAPQGFGIQNDGLRSLAACREGRDRLSSLVSSSSSIEPLAQQAQVLPDKSEGHDGNQEYPLQSLFAMQLEEVQQLLGNHHNMALQVAIHERTEALSNLEAKVLELRQENEQLRTALSNDGARVVPEAGTGEASAGTGEAACGAKCSPSSPAVGSNQAGEKFAKRHLKLPPVLPQHNRVVRDWISEAGVGSSEHLVTTPAGKPWILSSGDTPDKVEVQYSEGSDKAGAVLEGAGHGRARPSAVDLDDGFGPTPPVSPSALKRQGARNTLARGTRAISHHSISNRATRTAVFADVELLRERVRIASRDPKEYNVANFYKDTGFFQMVARNHFFDLFTLVVIFTNAVWMAFDADKNDSITLPAARLHFQVAEHSFCTYFTIEVFIRFMAFRRTVDAVRDRWFVFDFALVCLMIIETWIITLVILASGAAPNDASLGDTSILRIFKLVRLTRMARVLRLLNACPELMILIKGIRLAGPSVFFTLILLVCMIYVWGIFFTALTRGTPVGNTYFFTVADSMNTLLLIGCLGENLPDVVNMLGAESFLCGAAFMVFVLFASFMVMNMLMGVLVEVVSVVAAVEKETLVVSHMKVRLQSAIDDLEPDFDGTISQNMFARMIEHPDFLGGLKDVGVDVVELVDFSDFIFDKGDSVIFGDFIELVLQLRGTNKATLKDLIDLRRRLVQEMGRMEKSIIKQLQDGDKKDKQAMPRFLRGPAFSSLSFGGNSKGEDEQEV